MLVRSERLLSVRGHLESRRLREILEAQRSRVRTQMDHYEGHVVQLTLGFAEEERRQLEADVRSWRTA